MLGKKNLPYREDAPSRKIIGSPVRILVPHNWERNAVRPLVDRMIDGLDVHSVEMADSRARILERCRKLTVEGVGKEYHDVRAALFRLEDLWVRLEALTNALVADPGCAVVELHSMPKDHHAWDGISNEEDYYFRITGTWVVVPSDLCHSCYYVPFSSALDVLKLKRNQEKAASLARLFGGLDIGGMAGEFEERVGILRGASARAGLFEIPAKRAGAKLDKGVKPGTDFEDRHLCWDSLPAKLGNEEVRAVLGMFAGRKA